MATISTNPRGRSNVTEARPHHDLPLRSNLESFVHCLHLLDLDVAKDWPDITVQTLGTRTPAQNLHQRIKAVEWSLYRLCELYDSHIARDVGASSRPHWLLIPTETSTILSATESATISESACSATASVD
jgi:hypothetical protein